MANVSNCDIVLNEFEPQMRYYEYFQINTFMKCMNPPKPSCGLNITTTIILRGLLQYEMTHEG